MACNGLIAGKPAPTGILLSASLWELACSQYRYSAERILVGAGLPAMTDYQALRDARTNRNPAITTANTANVVLYNASAGSPNTSASTASHRPARPGAMNPIT